MKLSVFEKMAEKLVIVSILLKIAEILLTEKLAQRNVWDGRGFIKMTNQIVQNKHKAK